MLTTRRHPGGGFSLVELLITIAILGIVLSASLPMIINWLQNAEIRVAAENIQSGIQLARTEALRRNANVEFKLDKPADVGGTGWTVTLVSDGSVIQVAPSGEGTRNVKLVTLPDKADSIVFNGFGRLSSVAVAPLEQIDIDSASLSAADSRELRLVIINGSEVRMCDPAVTDPKDPRSCPA